MFNLFKNKPKDVKGIRNSLLHLIKSELKKNEGGEGANIKSIKLYFTGPDSGNHIYRAAVFADEPGRFKTDEVQKIADDFDIKLPGNWNLELTFTNSAPEGSVCSSEIDAAIRIITNRSEIQKQNVEAFIRTLNGETEKSEYSFNAFSGKINIGREIKTQTADGFFRKNFIAFINSDINPANCSVSRQHAHIEWQEEKNSFYLYADEGGIPPNNKMKVRGENGMIQKIQTTELGHKLSEGDQIILGENAVLEFSYKSTTQ